MEKPNPFKKFIQSIFMIGSFVSLNRILGIGSDVLMASVLGCKNVMDVYLMGFLIPSFFRKTFSDGAFGVSFIPRFTKIHGEEGLSQAITFSRKIFTLVLLTSILFVGLMEVFSEQIIRIVLQKKANDTVFFAKTLLMARMGFPYVGFCIISAFFGALLNALNHFAAPAFNTVILNLSVISALLFIHWTLDIDIFYIGLAVFLAGFVQVIWLWGNLKKIGVHMLPIGRFNINLDIRQFLVNFFPGLIAAGLWQINLSADYFFATYYTVGSMSSIFFAARLNQVPLMIFGASLATAILPFLSQEQYMGKKNNLSDDFNFSFKLSLFMSLPITIFMFCFGENVVGLLLERGQFGATDTIDTAAILNGFNLGIPAVLLTKVFSSRFYANQDTKTPFIFGIISIIFNLTLSYFFINQFGLKGLAYSASLSSYLYIFMLLGYLQKTKLATLNLTSLEYLGSVLVLSLLFGLSLKDLGQILAQNTLTIHSLCLITTILALYGLFLGHYRLLSNREEKRPSNAISDKV